MKPSRHPRLTPAGPDRPADQHDGYCDGARWLHHLPWKRGAKVVDQCAGCSAVRVKPVREVVSMRKGTRVG